MIKDTQQRSNRARMAIVMCAAILALAAPAIATETTTDLIFKTFDALDAQFGQLDQRNAQFTTQLDQIRTEKTKAIQDFKAAGSSGKSWEVREARSRVTLGIAQELRLRGIQMKQNQRAIGEARRQLGALREQLKQGLEGGTGEAEQRDRFERMKNNLQEFGRQIEDVLVFNQDKDSEVLSKIPDISLYALRTRYDKLVETASKRGPGSLNAKLYRSVDEYTRLLDQVLAYYTAMGQVLSNQKQLVEIASQLATAQLTYERVTGSSLGTDKLTQHLKNGVEASKEIDQQIKEIVLEEFVGDKGLDSTTAPFRGLEQLKRPNGRFF